MGNWLIDTNSRQLQLSMNQLCEALVTSCKVAVQIRLDSLHALCVFCTDVCCAIIAVAICCLPCFDTVLSHCIDA